MFYNVYSKYNIPRKGQGKSTRDYRGLTNLIFSFARHQQSLLMTNFPVKFIVIQNKSAVSKHWISVANTECQPKIKANFLEAPRNSLLPGIE